MREEYQSPSSVEFPAKSLPSALLFSAMSKAASQGTRRTFTEDRGSASSGERAPALEMAPWVISSASLTDPSRASAWPRSATRCSPPSPSPVAFAVTAKKLSKSSSSYCPTRPPPSAVSACEADDDEEGSSGSPAWSPASPASCIMEARTPPSRSCFFWYSEGLSEYNSLLLALSSALLNIGDPGASTLPPSPLGCSFLAARTACAT